VPEVPDPVDATDPAEVPDVPAARGGALVAELHPGSAAATAATPAPAIS
jgi:hypothetical protein